MSVTSRRLQLNQITRRSVFPAILTVVAIILMISSAVEFVPVSGSIGPHTLNAVVLALLGGMALFGALHFSPHRVEAAPVAEQPISPGKVNWLLLIPGLALLALGTEMSANTLQRETILVPNPHIQFLTLFLGLVLFTLGMIGVTARRFMLPRIDRKYALVLGLILLLGFFIRALQLDDLVRLSADEGHHMEGINAFLDSNYQTRLLTSTSGNLPPTMIFEYWNYLTSLIWGRNFWGLRMANVIIGTLTVLATYGAGTALFNRRIGILAALVLATFPAHVFFSRISLPPITDPLFLTLAIMFAARSYRWNRRSDWVLLGVCIGLEQYFYEVGRLIIPPIFVSWFILLAIVLGRKFGTLRKGVFLTVIASLIVISPMYFTMWYGGLPFVTRLPDGVIDLRIFERALQGIMDEEEMNNFINHLAHPFLVYTSHSNNGVPELYSGSEPLVLRVFVPLFLLGIFHLLYRIRSAEILLLITVFAVSAANIFANDALMFVRYLIIIPLLSIIIAVGIGCTLPMLNPFPKQRLRENGAQTNHRWRAAPVYCVALLISMVQFYYFFGHMMPEYNYHQRIGLNGDTMDVTLRFAERPNVLREEMRIYDPSYGVGIIPTIYITYALGLGDYPVEMKVSGDTTVDDLDALPRNRTYVFAVLPDDLRMIELLRQSFVLEPPMYSSFDSPVPQSLYVMFVAPHEKNLYPLHATPTGSGTVP